MLVYNLKGKSIHFFQKDIFFSFLSPNNSIYQSESPSNTYLRPKPPPYKGGSSRKSGVDI